MWKFQGAQNPGDMPYHVRVTVYDLVVAGRIPERSVNITSAQVWLAGSWNGTSHARSLQKGSSTWTLYSN